MFLAQDARSKEIASQVESIQAELTSLSMVEMTKTNLKVQYLTNQILILNWFKTFGTIKILTATKSSQILIGWVRKSGYEGKTRTIDSHSNPIDGSKEG